MSASNMGTPPEGDIPAHLRNFPGLYVRVGGEVIAASEEDAAVGRAYVDYSEKGPLIDGRRITIMTAHTTVRPGDPVRVIHISETSRPGDELPIMGPKDVLGEYVDENLVTQPASDGDDPLAPEGLYDGPVLSAPAVDYGWEITSYSFDQPGTHTVAWRPGQLESNTLSITVAQ